MIFLMGGEYEKCMAGEVFDGSAPDVYAITLRTKRLLRQLNDCDFDDKEGKRQILEKLFGSIGEDVHVDIDFHCEYGINIHVGSRVIINMNCTFVDNNRIDIGDGVLIASDVHIYTAEHATKVAERMKSDWVKGHSFCRTSSRPVKIEDYVWIGGGVTILPGVTIGKRSVIGAGSVVCRSIPADCVAVGNPCRVIKTIDNGQAPAEMG